MAVERMPPTQYEAAMRRQEELAKEREVLETGGGGGDFGGMEPRVARLEEDMKELKADAKAIRSDLAEIKVKLAELGGRFTGFDERLKGVPTGLQLVGFAVAVFVAAGVFRFFETRVFPTAVPSPTAASSAR